MDLLALETALDVARRGGFAAVARARNVDPSTVSRAVAALEMELGIRLFQRTTRRLSLTEAGAVYLDRVASLVEELARAKDEAHALRGKPTGTLRITASVAFAQICLLPLLGPFRQAFPDLAVDLVMTDATVDLIAERIDLAIRLAPSVDADVICAKLMETRYRVVASPGYLDREGHPETPAALTQRDCLRFDLPEFRNRWLFRSPDGAVDAVSVGGGIVISNALALRQAALDGLGPALLADWLIGGDRADGRLIDLFPTYDCAATAFDTAAWLIYPSRAYLPTKVRAAIDFLRERLPAETVSAEIPLKQS